MQGSHLGRATVDNEQLRHGLLDLDDGVVGETLRLTQEGYVGINTTSPGAMLDVNGSFRALGTGYFNGTLAAGSYMCTLQVQPARRRTSSSSVNLDIPTG